MTICDEVATDFPGLRADMEDRERIGMERYGVPLDPHEGDRDWLEQAREELLDGVVYLTAEAHRMATSKRVDAAARERWLVVRDVRRRLVRALADLDMVRGKR